MSILEKLLYSGQVMLIGLLIVFVVLIILIFAISMLAKAMRAMENKGKKEAAPVPAPAPVVEAAPVVQETVAEAEQVTDDAELIAVIAAALAAFDNSNKLVVRSVRRVSGWKNAVNGEQVYRF